MGCKECDKRANKPKGENNKESGSPREKIKEPKAKDWV